MNQSRPNSSIAIYVCGLAIAVAVVYFNSLSVPFTFDDVRNIQQNPAIRQFTWGDASDNYGLYRRPVGRWSLTLNYAIHGLDVRGYHALNIAIHLVNVLLLFGIVRRTLRLPGIAPDFAKRADQIAFAASLFWAVHPLCTQSVTYLIQRLESISCGAILLALYALLRSTALPRNRLWGIAAIAAIWAGVATKEVAAMGPLVALAFDRIFLATTWRELWQRRGWIYLGFVPSLVWLGMHLTPESGQFERLSRGITSWEYFRSQPAVILHYLRLAIWPDTLCLDYGWPIAQTWPEIALPGIVVVSLLLGTFIALWRYPRLAFLGLAFFFILAPTSSIVPILDLAFEHRMYLPLAPLVVLVVLAADSGVRHWVTLPERQRQVACVLFIVVAASLGMRTVLRNRQWADPIAFWADNIRVAPLSHRALANEAIYLKERGDYFQAIVLLDRSLSLKADNYAALHAYGQCLAGQGDYDGAIEKFQQAIAVRPTLDRAELGIALALESSDREADAIEHYETALRMNPRNCDAECLLAALLTRRGESSKATRHFQRAIALRPQSADLHDRLGNHYAKLQQFAAAEQEYRIATELQADFLPAYLHRAMALLDLGQHDEAARVARQLLRLRPDSQGAAELLRRATLKLGSHEAATSGTRPPDSL